jgi:predicted CoA-binding protein
LSKADDQRRRYVRMGTSPEEKAMSGSASRVEDFLAQKRIAVAGVSSADSSQAANMIYRRLRDSGYEVFAVNPKAEQVEGDTCYPDLKSIPGNVDGVVISTPPEAAEEIAKECAEVGVPRVWMHRSFGKGSVSDAATRFCDEHGIAVIPGGCPMMFCEPVDFGHKCMRWALRLTGGLPR